MHSRWPAAVLASALLALPGAPALALAQSVATISGHVADASGAVLPGATVVITNEDTGLTRTLVTDDEGRYRAADLTLGRYRLEASLTGFGSVVRTGVVLTVDREAIVTFALPVGDQRDEVTVSGDAPLVETKQSESAALVTREQVADLPLNARDFSQLMSMQAGTTYYRNQAGDAVSGLGARISVSGARPSANSFTLDGSDINSAQGTLPSGVTGAVLGVESMREFKVLTGNYSARYGRASGANILAVSRSGTNEIHGSGYWYHRNDSLDAKNFFDAEKLDFLRNQFGFSLGGPIAKNKLFYFVNFEGLRERLPRSFHAIVPTALARQGILPDRTVAVSPAVVPYLDLWPAPNGADLGNGTAEYNRSDEQPTDQNYMTFRVDYQINPSNTLFVRYTYDNSNVIEPRAIPLYADDFTIRNQYVTVEERMVLSSRLINQLRIAFARPTQVYAIRDLNAPPPSLAFLTGRPFGEIAPGSGISSLEGDTGQAGRQQFLNTYQLIDDIDFELGRHSLKFGFSGTMFLFNKLAPSRNGGVWTFGSWLNFLENQPSQLRILGFGTDLYRSYKQWLTSLYLQDDIRLRSNLTLNLGLRWDYTTVPTERYGRLANLVSWEDPVATVGVLYDNPSGDDFGPRVGLVWDPSRTGKSSVRAAFGVFQDPLLMKYYITPMDRQPPFYFEPAPTPQDLLGVFPNLDNHIQQFSAGPQAIHSMDYNANSPYAMQWNLGVQRMLGGSMVAEIGYTASRGIHLGNRSERALPRRQVVNGVSYFDPADNVLVNPAFSRNQFYGTGATSEYHALKATLTRRYSNGLHFQANYTWAKAMDTQSANLQNELGGTSHMDVFDQERDWALADYHVAHVFSGNASWELPFGEGKRWGSAWGTPTEALLGGWQLTGVVTATTGTPFTVQSHTQLTHPLVSGGSRPDLIPGGNPNPVLGGPDLYFDPLQFVPQQTGFYGNLGRNTLIGPGLLNVDMGVMKNLRLGGTKKLQVRGEFFNVLNRANFGLPASSLFDSRGRRTATAGRITRTVTPARQVQLAVRMEF